MSRSRKKVFGWCDSNPFMKNYANRRIRRVNPETFEIKLGTSKSNRTRKYSCSYDICDYKMLTFSSIELNDEAEAWWVEPSHRGWMK